MNKRKLKAWGGTAIVVVIVLIAIGFAKRSPKIKTVTDKVGM